MLDDFTPIIRRLDGRTIKVWAVADVHIGAKECDLDGFKRFLKAVEADDDSYIVIVGDLISNGLKSSVTNVYEEAMPPSAQIDLAVQLLEPVKHKILGMVSGNHERRSKKDCDIDPLFTIAAILRINDRFRQNMAFLRIILERGSTKENYAIMLTHGKTANKKKQFTAICEGIDAAIFAHTHTPDVLMPSRIRFTTSNRIVMHNVVVLTACSWLKSGGYSLSGLYVPQAVSTPQALQLEFNGTNSKKGRVSVIW